LPLLQSWCPGDEYDLLLVSGRWFRDLAVLVIHHKRVIAVNEATWEEVKQLYR